MARRTNWNTAKRAHKIRLTEECWNTLGDIADANALPSKTEAIEHLARFAYRHSIALKHSNEYTNAINTLTMLAQCLEIDLEQCVKQISDIDKEQVAQILQLLQSK